MTIFDNCLIQAPDGVNLSRCGLKKLRWYLDNGLADQIADHPPTIRLRFEPSGRRGLDDPLLLDGKPNLCVVCGTDEDLTRHHIIPYCFIRHMKIEYKVDVIRDIFPLCRSCHNDYEKLSQEKRREMSAEMGIPMFGIENAELRRVRRATGAAAALIEHRDKMPERRRQDLMAIVREFLGKEEVTDDEVEALRKYRITQREDYIHFSKYVAQNAEDYDAFARDWREHFVQTMKPRYMPEAWKVDRQTKDVWVPPRILRQLHQSESAPREESPTAT